MSIKSKVFEIAEKQPVLMEVYKKLSIIQAKSRKNMSDEEYLKLRYRQTFGKELNLDDPQSFNEKMQWLKLYDRKPIYTVMADKYHAREFISRQVGEKYVIPIYGVWENVDAIQFSELPNKYVMKCNHDSGGLFICRDNQEIDYKSVKKSLQESLNNNYYINSREWQYKDIKPLIIAEQLLENNDGSPLKEYDFFCFNGVPRIVSVCWGDRDRRDIHYNDFYDMEFNKLNFSCNYPVSKCQLDIPYNFQLMKDLSSQLSKDCAFLRVDVYECNGNTYIGELTFHHWNGFGIFNPQEWDNKLGEWITLPKAKEGR